VYLRLLQLSGCGVNMQKRIVLISSNSSARGGGERYLVYLTQGMRCLGHEVHALLSDVRYMDGWLEALGAEGAVVSRRHLLGLRDRPLRFLQSIVDHKQISSIANLCREIAPDAIVVNQQYDEDGLDYLAGALAAQVAPVGGIMHLPMTRNKHQRPLGSLRGKLLSWWYCRHPYRLIFVSRGSQEEFESYYACPRPTAVVNSGVPFREDPAVPPSLPIGWRDDNIPVVGFVGQFVLQKNLMLLVDGWLLARGRGVECRLLLVGDGPTRPTLEKRLKDAAPSEMWHITGWQDQPENFFSVMDLYAMTSHFEGLPLSLVEAAGCALPAVVVNFNGAIDVGKRAAWVRVVEDTDAAAVGQALAAAIAELPSLKAQARAGRQAFRDYFSPERMARDILAALGVG